MGVETLKKVRKAEEERAAKVRSAQAEAERIRARAAKAAVHIIEGAKRDAEAGVAALKAQKVDEGRAEAERILAGNERDLQAVRTAAERGMASAVGLVVKRVCSIEGSAA